MFCHHGPTSSLLFLTTKYYAIGWQYLPNICNDHKMEFELKISVGRSDHSANFATASVNSEMFWSMFNRSTYLCTDDIGR